MRVARAVAFISGVIAVALPAVVIAAEGAQRQNPYAQLFTGQFGGAPTPRPAPVPHVPFNAPLSSRQPSQDNRTIVCGLTVVQGDSKIDPAMPHHLPTNAPKATIRIVPAPGCQK